MPRRGCLTPICHRRKTGSVNTGGPHTRLPSRSPVPRPGSAPSFSSRRLGFQLWATNPRPGWRRRHPTRGFWHRHQQFSGEWFGRGVLRRSGVSTHPDQRPEHRRLHYKCSHRSRQRRTGIAFPMANAPRCAARQRLAPCVAAAYILRTDVGTFPALEWGAVAAARRMNYAYSQSDQTPRQQSSGDCRDSRAVVGCGVRNRPRTAASSRRRGDWPWSCSRSWAGRVRARDRAWRGSIWLSVWVWVWVCARILLSGACILSATAQLLGPLLRPLLRVLKCTT